MFKVLAYDADLFVWCMIGKYGTAADGRAAMLAARTSREWQFVTLAHVTFEGDRPRVEVLDSNTPGFKDVLANLEGYRAAALRN